MKWSLSGRLIFYVTFICFRRVFNLNCYSEKKKEKKERKDKREKRKGKREKRKEKVRKREKEKKRKRERKRKEEKEKERKRKKKIEKRSFFPIVANCLNALFFLLITFLFSQRYFTLTVRDVYFFYIADIFSRCVKIYPQSFAFSFVLKKTHTDK